MADLRAKERAALPDSAFAYIDGGGRRRLPIHDEAHVRNALARFNRVLFEDEAARDRARTRLLRAAKRHGIVPVGFIEGQLRPRLPTGQLTLLFADVEDSSGHLAALGDRYGAVLSGARRLLRSAIRRSRGTEVDAHADEFFAVFASAADALTAATEVQRALAAHDWPDARAVRVRIGLHVGRPSLVGGTYQGISVNTAARICAAGHGGQVLLSRAAHTALGEAGVELRSLGIHRLRGIGEPVEIYQALVPELPSTFPALRTDAEPITPARGAAPRPGAASGR
jgi:class 3 adenylate cyclase